MITVLKEIKQLLEEILAELKKPTAVTVDSEKLISEYTKLIKDNSETLKDHEAKIGELARRTNKLLK